jgi:tetratricopeptide (TPR) repeat protein
MDSSMTNAPATYVAEWEIMKNDFLNGSPEINSWGACPDVPLVMLVAGKNRPPNWEKSVRSLYENKMKKLSETRIIELAQSPHYIQAYEPSLVIENIRRVVFPDAENVLRKKLRAKGIDSCIAEYKKIKMGYPKEYILERFLNTLGYEELNRRQEQSAIKLFALNVEMYPKSSNVYDSLGEAYMVAGNKKEAIKNYEKSLALNPANRNAMKMLEKLK